MILNVIRTIDELKSNIEIKFKYKVQSLQTVCINSGWTTGIREPIGYPMS